MYKAQKAKNDSQGIVYMYARNDTSAYFVCVHPPVCLLKNTSGALVFLHNETHA